MDVQQLPVAIDTALELPLSYSVVVTNTGRVVSDVVVLAFVSKTKGSHADMPLRRLVGFDRISTVAPGDSHTAHFEIDADALRFTDDRGETQLGASGEVRIEIGDIDHPASHTVLLR